MVCVLFCILYDLEEFELQSESERSNYPCLRHSGVWGKLIIAPIILTYLHYGADYFL